MRNLLLMLMRHAQAADVHAGADFDRPLSARGLCDTRVTAIAAAEVAIPDIVLCSSALRTLQTANIFKETTAAESELIAIPGLYLAPAADLWRETESYLASFERVLVIGHNPGISYLGQKLCGKDFGGPMKTSELAIFEAECHPGQTPGLSDFALVAAFAKGAVSPRTVRRSP